MRALLVALLAVGCAPSPPSSAWTDLVEPHSVGREVTRGYVLSSPSRGHEHDVVFRATRSDGRAVEVHFIDRGRWRGVRETRSFGVAWEAPRTTAPRDDAEAVTEALAVALRAHDRGGPVDHIALTRTERPPWWQPLADPLSHLGTWRHVPWALIAVILAALALRPKPARGDLALVASALALRVSLGAFGPLHINGQGPLWILGARRPEELVAYGPGWFELQGLLARFIAPDRAVFAVNLALSSLAAPLMAALARRVGLSWGAALLAGALVVGDPALVRVAATESYFTALVALPLASAWALVAALDLADRRARWSATLAGALFAVATARMHPLGLVALAWVPLVIFARHGALAALRATLVVGAALALTSGRVFVDVVSAVSHGVSARPAWWGGASWVIALALLTALHPRVRRLTPALVVSAALAGVIAATYAQHDVWRQCALRVVATPVALALASLAPASIDVSGRAAKVAAAVSLLTLVAGVEIVRHRTTDEAEYAWARSELRALPPSCRLAWVAFAGPRRTLFLPAWEHRGESLALDARAPLDARARLSPLGCTWYLHTSACESVDGAQACEAVERELSLTDVKTVTLEARVSHRWLPYRGRRVAVRLSRVRSFAP